MTKSTWIMLALPVLLAPGCKEEISSSDLAAAVGQKELRFGIIGKSNNNPVFQAARRGAEDAARELGAKHGVTIRIDWRTPDQEDPQKQANYIEQLTLARVSGIAISCSDANRVTHAINASPA